MLPPPRPPQDIEEILGEDEPTHNRLVRWNSRFAEWTTRRVLASLWMFNIALVLPLFGIGNTTVELWLLVVSNWIQWWALPVLQRSQNKIQNMQLAMAKMEHRNVLYLMDMIEQVEREIPGS